jgi:hypothetical protein
MIVILRQAQDRLAIVDLGMRIFYHEGKEGARRFLDTRLAG